MLTFAKASESVKSFHAHRTGQCCTRDAPYEHSIPSQKAGKEHELSISEQTSAFELASLPPEFVRKLMPRY
jgi:hypothetical protein